MSQSNFHKVFIPFGSGLNEPVMKIGGRPVDLANMVARHGRQSIKTSSGDIVECSADGITVYTSKPIRLNQVSSNVIDLIQNNTPVSVILRADGATVSDLTPGSSPDFVGISAIGDIV